MDSEVRHDLEKNELADILARSGSRVRPYLAWLAILVGVFAIAMASLVYWRGSVQDKRAQDWEIFRKADSADALEQIIADQPQAVFVPYAQNRLAWIRLSQAKDQILDDRIEALRLSEDAIELFQEIAGSTADLPDLKPQAALGIGLAKECQAKIAEAKAQYELVLDSYSGQSAADIARYRLDKLNKPETAGFYTELKNYSPKEPSTDLPPPTDLPIPGITPTSPGAINPELPDVTPGAAPGIDIPLPPDLIVEPKKPEDAKPEAKPEEPKGEEPKPEAPTETPAAEPKPEAPAPPATEEPAKPAETPPAPEQPAAPSP